MAHFALQEQVVLPVAAPCSAAHFAGAFISS